MSTNLSINAVTEKGSYGVMDKTTENGIRPEKLAEIVLDEVEKGRSYVDVGQDFKTRVAVWLVFLWPEVLGGIMKKRFKKNKKKEIKTTS